VYKQVYDQNGKPIEGLYVDMNHDGVINTSDLYRYKNRLLIMQWVSRRTCATKLDFSSPEESTLATNVYNNVLSNRGTYLDVYNPGLNYLSNVLKASKDIHLPMHSIFRLFC
jgi:iron complex outermembrane receptor protein